MAYLKPFIATALAPNGKSHNGEKYFWTVSSFTLDSLGFCMTGVGSKKDILNCLQDWRWGRVEV